MQKVKLIEVIMRTPSIKSFRFLPEEKINFIPGQFLQIIFDPINQSNKELNKYLSFSSSPTKDYIEVTKRLSESRFSEALKNLKINDQVFINASLGSCIFKEEYKKIGFLIGGIGITPVISIIEYIIDKKLDTDVNLIYSNRTKEEIAFKEELDKWQNSNKNIKITYIITDNVAKDKNFIYGRINQDLIKEQMPDLNLRTLFIFGPPQMVKAMQDISLSIGIDKKNLKVENFIGY